ncbi:ASKHA domain-containing protein [Agathobaculum sp. LCP25S3_E8]|uniref:ASKHA domain-containing protein n=1 Tax=Agathobaculum sp. LCP25S3_E8 TaxID=3438735 RepID=UPI003F91098E
MTITVKSGAQTLSFDTAPGETLGDVLRRAIPTFSEPCGGNHTCGKCGVHIEGAIPAPSASDQRLLSTEELEGGVRLACSCPVVDGMIVRLTESGLSRIVGWNKTVPFDCTEIGYGIAVDIGTTTVAMQLLDRASGKVLAEQLEENAQCSFGADVISRIKACKTDGLDILSSRIHEQLQRMAATCLQEACIEHVDEAVVTGNSTMLHLYEGLDPASLAVAPFDVQSYFGCMSRHTLAGAPVYLPRCVGAYVGADIVCAILAAGMDNGVQLLTDIGTNGEMVLMRSGNLYCCATAAGPAFEGAGLSCGMPAAAGAIRAMRREGDRIIYQTIQDAPAVGICGSGILDALAILLKDEIMDDSGYLDDNYTIDGTGVTITQRDVRQIQLAKSAICAGLITLLETQDLPVDAVDRLAIAGGFGNSMNMNSACAIGLFPIALRDKADFIGNGALGGAAMLLMNHALREKSEQMAQNSTEISLSANPTFMDYYIDCMSFMTF